MTNNCESGERVEAGTRPSKHSNGKDEDIIGNLGSLSPFEYERQRQMLADQLGVRVSFLDRRYEQRSNCLPSHAAEPFMEPVKPWDKPVDGAELLDSLAEIFDRYLLLPNGGSETCALWSLHTHAYDCFPVSPYLSITSPTPECGKTTLTAVIEAVVANPIQASNISSAAVYRAIERWHPTLIVDEADTFLRDNTELRGILNAGHRRNAFVIRVEGDKHEPRRFSVWCPKVIAMIGKPHPTLSGRSIMIELKRKTMTEKRERLTERSLNDDLARKCARWAADNESRLRSHQPNLPESLFNRSADNWITLITIADLAGGQWPNTARELATTAAARKDGDVTSVMLLLAIRDLFEEKNADRLASAEIVERLTNTEGSPWPEFHNGRPISMNQVANLLKEHKVHSKQVRFGLTTRKGYMRDDFRDAFKRYLR
jgi:putative DNA primase/helicase